MECIPVKKYICNICNKEYSSRQNLWKHNSKFHSEKETNITVKKEEIKQKNEKYNCKKCKAKFNNITDLDTHIKLKCKPDIKHNNVFKFNTNTFGKNKYSDDNGGDIYIIQTDFTLKGYYKIGVTTNLYHRMSSYRCGAVIEPRIHCYFPIKNIKKSDTLMKKKLIKYNIKREIYKADNLADITKIIKELQKEMNSDELEVLPEIKNCDMVECKYCDTVHTSNYELNIHLVNCEKHIEITKNLSKENDSKYICKKCNKTFNSRQTKWRHEQTCEDKNKEERNEIEMLKILVGEMKKEIIELKKQLIFGKKLSNDIEV